MIESNVSRLELQVHMNRELGRHYLTETALRELEMHVGIELNRTYRIPEIERERMKVRDNY